MGSKVKIMMRIQTLYGLLLLTLAVAVPGFAQPQNVLTARVEPTPVTVARGGKTMVNVKLTVQKSYHVNANPPSEEYLIPTQVTLGTAKGMTVGRPVYPKGHIFKFSFSDKPLSVYEGSVTVKVPVAVSKQARTGTQNLTGTVKYQACNERSCLAPTTAKFALTLRVK